MRGDSGRVSFRAASLLTALSALALSGCDLSSADDAAGVVLYTSVDQQIAQPIVEAFQQKTGIPVHARYDTELTKTTGLVQRLRLEAERPACDVFWSGEVFHTIRLAEEGLFEPIMTLPTPAEVNLTELLADWPEQYRDVAGRWYGFALRARVIAYNTDRLRADEVPVEITELAGPRWKDKVLIARPSFGTTGGHVASWFALFGPERAEQFLRELRENGLRVVEGNSTAVRAVALGQAELCLTDTDDVWAAQRNGWPVDLVYPRHGEQGTLLIPNTVARVRGGPNPAPAARLIAYLLSSETERALAASDSHNIPVREALAAEFEQYAVESPMAVSYEQIAEQLEPALRASAEILEP
jgi:iron(III) transport system substrate-binding protein